MEALLFKYGIATTLLLLIVRSFYCDYRNVMQNYRDAEYEELDRARFLAMAEWANYLDDHDGYDFIDVDVKQLELRRAFCNAQIELYEFDLARAQNHCGDIILFLEFCYDEDQHQRILDLLCSR